MPGRLEFDVNFARPSGPRADGRPMRLLVLGDFSGKPAADRMPLQERAPHRVDVDTFDQVLRRVAPRLNGTTGEIAFSEIDDFHPDRLYTRLERFRSLREARTNPPAEHEDLLRRLLGRPAPTDTAAPAPPTGVDALIRRIVAPHIVADTLAGSRSYQAAVDSAIAEEMRALLHDPAFQAIESAWRGVHWLVTNLELDDHLQLHVLDVTRDELLADLGTTQETLSRSSVYRNLAERSRDALEAHGWSVLVAMMEFGPSDEDIRLLAGLAWIASQAGAPILGGATPELAGGATRDLAAWHALRRSAAGRWIGLVTPRVLLRLPYGTNSDPVEEFAFEEFAGQPAHEHFLWGNGALAAALLIGRAFSARGWSMEPGDEREIADLPAYTIDRGGEREMQACAERYLTERDVHALLAGGLMPLASRRDRNSIVAIRFQSVSDPPAALPL